MRFLLNLSLLLISYSLLSQNSQEFIVSVSSAEVSIGGQTNLNRFVCSISLENESDTLVIDANYAGDTLIFSGLFLKFPVDQFECQLKLMNRDFQEFLNSDIYPELLMSVEEMVINRDNSLMEKVSVRSQVHIILCGQKREFDIKRGYVMELENNQTRLVCTEVVRFTDFEMIPPSKFLGAVRVQDEMVISLDLTLDIKPI